MKTRHTQSKQKIKDALLSLLMEKDFEKISVADITRRADINRGTFYLHFIDKFDLIDKMIEHFKLDLFTVLTDTSINEEEALLHALTYLKNNKHFIYTLSKSKASDLQNEIENFLKKLLTRNNRLTIDIIKTLNFPQDYAYTAFFGSITALVIYWINGDFQEDPYEIAEMLISIRQLFNIK